MPATGRSRKRALSPPPPRTSVPNDRLSLTAPTAPAAGAARPRTATPISVPPVNLGGFRPDHLDHANENDPAIRVARNSDAFPVAQGQIAWSQVAWGQIAWDEISADPGVRPPVADREAELFLRLNVRGGGHSSASPSRHSC